jgi:hypothetical protein
MVVIEGMASVNPRRGVRFVCGSDLDASNSRSVCSLSLYE